jgi:hypothetical protein
VAQGRVWTGKQGKSIGLVDHLGGLSTAVGLVRYMCNATNPDTKKRLDQIRIEVMEAKGRSFPFAGLQASASLQENTPQSNRAELMAMCDALIFDTGLVSPESLGCGSAFFRNLGLPSSLRFKLESLTGFEGLLKEISAGPNILAEIVKVLGKALG